MSQIKKLGCYVVLVLTLFQGFNASPRSILKQNNQNLTTISHDEIVTNLNLVQIDYGHNQITEFNSSIFSQHRILEVIILSYNEFYYFPQNDSFLLSNSLERFECVACGISIIYKETFSEIPKLKEVDLSNNRVSLIMDGAFEKSFFLSNLNLSFNILKKIPINLLNRSAVNAKLTVNNNLDFDFVANEVLLKSKMLKEFQCNNCGISTIYEQTFSELPNIEIIYLNDNKVSAITKQMFAKNPNITSLFLERNNLTDFQSNIFNVIVKLKALCIDENPFTVETVKQIKNYYTKASLRTNCTEKDSKKYFENGLSDANSNDSNTSSTSPLPPLPHDNENSMETKPNKKIGISDAFIASYLLIILVAQAAVIGALLMYWFKIVLTEKIDEFDYSSNVLNDHAIYDVS